MPDWDLLSQPEPEVGLVSAPPGNRHLLPQRVPPPLISRLPATPVIFSQTPPKRVPTPQRRGRRSRLSFDYTPIALGSLLS